VPEWKFKIDPSELVFFGISSITFLDSDNKYAFPLLSNKLFLILTLSSTNLT